jgi:4a-hydroxytetrahydrobiopterin dehydratase
MKDLAEKDILPYRESVAPLSESEIETYLEILPGWKIVEREDIPRLEKRFPFDNFRAAVVFTNQVADLADEADHHPAILVSSIRCAVSWWTHIFKRLHLNDFIMAARTDLLFQEKND